MDWFDLIFNMYGLLTFLIVAMLPLMFIFGILWIYKKIVATLFFPRKK